MDEAENVVQEEEEVDVIVPTMKQEVKHQEDVEEEIIQGNIEEGTTNLKLNVIIIKNMVILLGSVEVTLKMRRGSQSL